MTAAAKLLDLCARLSGELQQANAAGGGFHVHKHVHSTVNVMSYDDEDPEFAKMIQEATNGFDPVVIARLKALAGEDTKLLADDKNVIDV